MHPPEPCSSRFLTACGQPLTALSARTIQVNIGLKCNLACRHCHVESSPHRTESMSWQTMQTVLDWAQRLGIETLDITGGAPEMHTSFRRFVSEARKLGLHVIVRTNLTVMLLEEHRDLPHWLARRQVHLVASLPCYLATNVDRQRGRQVHSQSIAVLRQLNEVGYGRRDELRLDLIYNPLGTKLPPDQSELESAYRRELKRRFGIDFHRLATLANFPIGRFQRDLERDGKLEAYQSMLQSSFNPATLPELMCRHQWHVGWDGTLYDCDFNFALGIPAAGTPNIRDVDPHAHLRRTIMTGDHCFACTAGRGSSCGGALVSVESRTRVAPAGLEAGDRRL